MKMINEVVLTIIIIYVLIFKYISEARSFLVQMISCQLDLKVADNHDETVEDLVTIEQRVSQEQTKKSSNIGQHRETSVDLVTLSYLHCWIKHDLDSIVWIWRDLPRYIK